VRSNIERKVAIVSAASTRPDALLEDLAIACRELAREGHENGNWGHLAVRDPDGRGLWLKRNAIGLGEVESADDFVLLDFDGNQLAGDGGKHLEWPIHAEIMRARPEVVATAHTHATPLQLFSATDVELQQLTPESTVFTDGIPRFRETCDLIVTPEMGRRLAASLGNARAVLLQSHGGAIAGRSVAELAVTAISLTTAIEAQRALAASGWPVIEADHAQSVDKGRATFNLKMMDVHWAFNVRRDARLHGPHTHRGDEAVPDLHSAFGDKDPA
jgi:L-fuculose-phosphate aldolase